MEPVMPRLSALHRSWQTTLAFVCALLFVLYSLFGWLILPGLIKDQVTQNLKRIANWDAQIGSVQFNPWALSLEVLDLTTADAKGVKQVGFERLYINFSALRSFDGTLSFAAIELNAPYVNLTLDPEGVTNLQRAFAAPDTETEPATSEPLALFFENIALTSGQLELNDHSKDEAFHLDLQPLSLNLVEFATNNNDGGDYRLDIALGDQQRLRWQGQIGIAPLTSSGQLALENLQLTTFWHYLKPLSPFWLKQGALTLSGGYAFNLREGKPELLIKEGKAVLADLALATEADVPEFLTLKQLTVTPIDFDLAKHTASIGSIELDTLETTIVRDPEGVLPVLSALKKPTAESTETAPQSPPEATPFNWTIGDIKLRQGILNWQDQTLPTPAEISTRALDLKLSGLTQDLAQPVPLQGSGKLGEAPLALSGTLTPAPFSATGDLTIEDLPLAQLQGYLSAHSRAQIQSGSATLHTRYDVTQQDDALSGVIRSELQVHQLALGAAGEDESLLGFESLNIAPLELTLKPLAIAVGTATLNQPFGDMNISEIGEVNLAALINAADDTATPVETDASAAEPVPIKLDRFKMVDGRFSFADSSVSPPFATRLSELNGQLEGLSSDTEQPARINFDGNLNKQGQLYISGTLNPLAETARNQLKLRLNNVDLAPTSPYAVRFLGYPVKKGKLGLDVDYQNEGAKLKASNTVHLNQITLGAHVKGPEALDLPLPFALALLQDGDGKIELDLPVQGNIDDPNFSVGSIVMNAFTSLLTKTITSPFSVLGALIGSSSQDMSNFAFAAGKADIDPAQHAQLQALAEALNKRPALTLEIKGVVDQTPDRSAMQTRKLEKRLGEDRERTREELVRRWLTPEQAKALDAIGDSAERIVQTEAALRKAIPVTPLEFSTLANQRAQNLAGWLASEGKVAEDRLFVINPAITDSGANEKTTVASEFGLGAR
jgi:outer membrane protein OmpA-like peptidoglycan-associated protein